MAIKQLEINGYRSLKHAVWKPGSLNLIVGPNGSGKSNLLRLLALISEAAHGHLAKSISDSGGMVPMLWDHQPGSFGWKLSFDMPPLTPAMSYEMCIEQVHGGSAYRIELDSYTCWNEPGKDFGTSKNSGYRRDGQGNVTHRAFIDGKTTDMKVPKYDENESLMSEFTWPYRDELRSWTLHQDTEVGPASSMRRPTTTQYVRSLSSGGGNLIPVLHTFYTSNRDFKKAIDDGMRAGFGNEYERLEFQPAAAQQIQLAVQWKSSSEPHAGQELSDGTLRFLFLLTCLAHPEPPPLVAIEEPDTGLHPSMLPIIAEYASAASESTQLFITSHSPDFLDAFSGLSPTVTLCNWEAGATHLYTLDSERLAKWLERYRLGHLFTSGELEALAQPDVEPVGEDDEAFEDLPPEDAALSEGPGESVGGENA